MMGHALGGLKFAAPESMLVGDPGGSGESETKYRVFLLMVEDSIY